MIEGYPPILGNLHIQAIYVSGCRSPSFPHGHETPAPSCGMGGVTVSWFPPPVEWVGGEEVE